MDQRCGGVWRRLRARQTDADRGPKLNLIAEAIIAVAELVEAEGRILRRSVARLGWSLLLLALAGLSSAIGLTLCLWALYRYLRWITEPATAGLLVGLLALMIAGGLIWASRRLTR